MLPQPVPCTQPAAICDHDSLGVAVSYCCNKSVQMQSLRQHLLPHSPEWFSLVSVSIELAHLGGVWGRPHFQASPPSEAAGIPQLMVHPLFP